MVAVEHLRGQVNDAFPAVRAVRAVREGQVDHPPLEHLDRHDVDGIRHDLISFTFTLGIDSHV